MYWLWGLYITIDVESCPHDMKFILPVHILLLDSVDSDCLHVNDHSHMSDLSCANSFGGASDIFISTSDI